MPIADSSEIDRTFIADSSQIPPTREILRGVFKGGILDGIDKALSFYKIMTTAGNQIFNLPKEKPIRAEKIMKNCGLFLLVILLAADLNGQISATRPLPNQSDSSRIKFVQNSEWGFGVGFAYANYNYSGLDELSALYSNRYKNSVKKFDTPAYLDGVSLFIYYKYKSFSYQFGGVYYWNDISDNQDVYLAVSYDVIKPFYIGVSADLLRINDNIHVGATIENSTYSSTYIDAVRIKGSIPSAKLYAGFMLKIIAIEAGYAFSFNKGTSLENIRIKAKTEGLFFNFHVNINMGGR